jgi:hypothetical protein
MAAAKRKRGRQPSWVAPKGCPAQIDGETRLAYQLFVAYWEEWATLPPGDASDTKAQRQRAFTAAERRYVELRPDAKNTKFVMKQFGDRKWADRCEDAGFVAPKKTSVSEWTPPDDMPPQLPWESDFDWMLLCRYRVGWDANADAPERQRMSIAQSIAADEYVLHKSVGSRFAAETAIGNIALSNGWHRRVTGTIPEAELQRLLRYGPGAPSEFPGEVAGLLAGVARLIALEIGQLQRVSQAVDRALLDKSICGFEAETTGIVAIDSLTGLLAKSRSAITAALAKAEANTIEMVKNRKKQ